MVSLKAKVGFPFPPPRLSTKNPSSGISLLLVTVRILSTILNTLSLLTTPSTNLLSSGTSLPLRVVSFPLMSLSLLRMPSRKANSVRSPPEKVISPLRDSSELEPLNALAPSSISLRAHTFECLCLLVEASSFPA